MEFTTKLKKNKSFLQPSRNPANTQYALFSYSSSQPKGFTLIEVLIVIVIIGILAGIAVFQLDPVIKQYRLTGAARLVWGDLQNAKMTAIKANRSIPVTFIPTTSYSYPLPQITPPGPDNTFTRDLSSEYPNITVSKTGNAITFSSTGQIPNATGGDITVQVQGSSGTKTITLSWTGRVVLN